MNDPAMNARLKQAAFTLIELMVVVAIIGILAAIAYPSYIEYVQRARRADGQAAILRVQLAQEKWRANNTSYGSLSAIGAPAQSDDKFYSIAVSNLSATGYTVTATSTAQLAGACHTLTLTVSAGGETPGPDACW
ncbi:type IV pilin protein [Thauera chlorobenzoica]|nr:type IV pilin protein [Thauera chlorobenzoica]SEF79245.1 type IV pilus assembly protein PilE [Thauera chlorobenzoica]